MDGSGELVAAALLFADLILDWIRAAISGAIAIAVRRRTAGAALAIAVGAIEGLVGSRLELLDLYLTREGWASLDALTLITVVLSALASLLWWGAVRALDVLVRRMLQPAMRV